MSKRVDIAGEELQVRAAHQLIRRGLLSLEKGRIGPIYRFMCCCDVPEGIVNDWKEIGHSTVLFCGPGWALYIRFILCH